MSDWNSTSTPGVYYREHKTRKNGIKKDRYFAIRYRLDGKVKNEPLGWSSQGWTEQKVNECLCELKRNQRTGCGPKTLAEKRDLNKEEEKKQHLLKKEECAKNVSFKEMFDKYIIRVQKDESEKSYTRKLGLFNKWINPILGAESLNSIKPADIEKIKDNMFSEEQSVRSVEYALTVITQTFKHAETLESFNGIIPTSKVKISKKDNKRERFLTKQEAEILLVALKNSSEQMHDIALLSLYCGLRAGEIFELKWQDVNFDSNRLFIKDRKGGENALLPIHDKVRNMLMQRKEENTIGFIFRSRKGEKIEEVSNAYARAVKKLGFNNGITDSRQKVVFHTLRHTYASWLVMSDVDLYTVQRLLGHKDITMTQRYAHLAPEHLDKAVSVLT